jgi:hypothetical protein
MIKPVILDWFQGPLVVIWQNIYHPYEGKNHLPIVNQRDDIKSPPTTSGGIQPAVLGVLNGWFS